MNDALMRKLGIKPGQRVLLVNGPEAIRAAFAIPPDETPAEGITYDALLVFARTKAELDASAPAALAALKPDGLLWGFYPKGTSKAQTDLTRDRGWDAFTEKGLEIVAAISVDAFWSGSRYRPTERFQHRWG